VAYFLGVHVFYTFYDLNEELSRVDLGEVSMLLQSAEQLASFAETMLMKGVLLHQIEVLLVFERLVESHHHGMVEPL